MAWDSSGAPKTLQEKEQILMFSKIMHNWNFLLQITRLKARGRQKHRNPDKQNTTVLLTSKQSEFTSDLGSRSRLSIFSNRVSKLSPVDMLLLLWQYPRTSTSSGKQFQPTSSGGGFAAAGQRSRNLRVTRCARFPLLPLTEGISALQTPGRGQRRPTAAPTPKVASHPAAPHDSRQRRRHQPRCSGEVLQPSGPQPPSPWRVPRPERGRRWERKRSRVETTPGSRGGRRGKAKAKGGWGAVPAAAAAAAAWATGPTRSAQRRCRRSSPSSPAFLGAARRTDPTLPRAGPRGIASLSHFVP